MHELERFDDDAGGVAFRDLILLALSGFIAIVVLLLPHINPQGEAHEAPAPVVGNVVVEIRWPDGIDADVDLWVQAPGDVPVGYSNKGGLVFNLLRDDLGKTADATNLNYEMSFSRGIPAGEYTVNLHLFRDKDGVYPIPVSVVTSVRKSEAASLRQLLTTKVELNRENEEITAYRFSLDENGDLVADSVDNLQRPLRSAGQG